jgi:hypothetical protein
LTVVKQAQLLLKLVAYIGRVHLMLVLQDENTRGEGSWRLPQRLQRRAYEVGSSWQDQSSGSPERALHESVRMKLKMQWNSRKLNKSQM